MLSKKLCGYNVVHLIYPLRMNTRYSSLKRYNNPFENNDKWEKLYTLQDKNQMRADNNGSKENNADKQKDKDNEEKQYYFSSLYNYEEVNIIPTEQIASYFHPTVHDILLHNIHPDMKAHKKLLAYRRKKCDFYGTYHAYFEVNDEEKKVDKADLTLTFEWLAAEVYRFNKIHFLVIRLAMHEKQKGKIETVDKWIKFVSRVRLNHKKYCGQAQMYVGKSKQDLKHVFFYWVQKFVDQEIGREFVITNRSIEPGSKQKFEDFKLRETVAFVHGYICAQQNKKYWNRKELYQLISVDENPGDSGGTTDFIKTFLKHHSYDRWANYGTHYMCIDYAAITAMTMKERCAYRKDFDKNNNKKKYNIQPLYTFYQHHCKIYLLMILLQLYYREMLQELKGSYSRIGPIGKSDYQVKRTLSDFYDLNQYFIFDRLTNEIQGVEMWEHYERCFGITPLYKSVQQDMRELNQRLIEYQNERQSRSIFFLTLFAGFTGIMGMGRVISEEVQEGPAAWLSSDLYVAFLRYFAIVLAALLFVYTIFNIYKMGLRWRIIGFIVGLLFILMFFAVKQIL